MTWQQKLIKELKFWDACRPYGIGMWQCPKFLFVIMGFITVISMAATHLVAVRHAEPEVVVLSVVGVSMVIFTIGYIVVDGFEKLASVSRMKTEFVSIVSHQLRTPLSSIRWSLDAVLSERSGKVSSEQMEYISTIRNSNDRMIKLVDDLLNITKIEQGRIVLKKEKVDLSKLIDEVIEELSPYAKANKVTLETKIEAKNLKVNADRQYLTIAISSFVDNAIRYIKNSGEVTVTLTKKDQAAKIVVEDNGVGISKEEQKNVFRKFFRTKNEMRHRTEGTGIGLYLTKTFVELHGGKVGFSSEEGKGSKFWFKIPAVNS